jgi:hypothetical protein
MPSSTYQINDQQADHQTDHQTNLTPITRVRSSLASTSTISEPWWKMWAPIDDELELLKTEDLRRTNDWSYQKTKNAAKSKREFEARSKSNLQVDRRSIESDRRSTTSDRRSTTSDRRSTTSDRRSNTSDRRSNTSDRRSNTSDRRSNELTKQQPIDRIGSSLPKQILERPVVDQIYVPNRKRVMPEIVVSSAPMLQCEPIKIPPLVFPSSQQSNLLFNEQLNNSTSNTSTSDTSILNTSTYDTSTSTYSRRLGRKLKKCIVQCNRLNKKHCSDPSDKYTMLEYENARKNYFTVKKQIENNNTKSLLHESTTIIDGHQVILSKDCQRKKSLLVSSLNKIFHNSYNSYNSYENLTQIKMFGQSLYKQSSDVCKDTIPENMLEFLNNWLELLKSVKKVRNICNELVEIIDKLSLSIVGFSDSEETQRVIIRLTNILHRCRSLNLPELSPSVMFGIHHELVMWYLENSPEYKNTILEIKSLIDFINNYKDQSLGLSLGPGLGLSLNLSLSLGKLVLNPDIEIEVPDDFETWLDNY